MTARATLELVQKMLLDAEEKEAKRLGECIRAWQAEMHKLEMLRTFRTDYEARYREALARGDLPVLIANMQAFLARLEEAIAIQEQAVQQAAHQRTQQEAVWQAAMGKRKAFDLLLARQEIAEHAEEEKKVQKLLDEWVTQRSARQRAALSDEEGEHS
ncbi:MAG: flagellar export protein FliJ [Hydrogenophilus sp.]|nr:flagellar export protein FliJ [Hydrogenophilus sp.]